VSEGGAQRIPDATELDDAQRELIDAMRVDSTGRTLNLFRVLVHHPLLLDRVAALGRVFLREGTLPARERELVILRVSWRLRSRYEFAQHVRLGRAEGVTDTDVERVAREELDGWPAHEAAFLRLADELLEADAVGEATWQEAASRLDTQQLLELVWLVGYYRMLAGFLRAVGIPVEDTVEVPRQAAAPGWL
jgi:4-carboxymuconolactone decarboxylase